MDMPIIKQEDKIRVCRYVTNENTIKQHSFLPLIRRKIYSYPYKCIDETTKKKIKRKLRNITFASHIDATIMAFYGKKLAAMYEKFLKENNISDEVSAYRKDTENRRRREQM